MQKLEEKDSWVGKEVRLSGVDGKNIIKILCEKIYIHI